MTAGAGYNLSPVRVLEHHPEGVAVLPGYVWLDTPGKPRHEQESELEFTDQPPV